MKLLKPHCLAILPLLSVLSLSPSDVQMKYASRSIASEEPQIIKELAAEQIKVEVPDIKIELPDLRAQIAEEKHPKLKTLISEVDPQSIVVAPNLNIEVLKVGRDNFRVDTTKLRQDFKVSESDKKIVREQELDIKTQIIYLLLLENDLKTLQDRKGIDPSEVEKTTLAINEGKDILEGLIEDLQKNKELIAKAEAPKQEVVKKEEPKVENKEVVKKDEKVEEKKEEPKEVAKKEETCDHEKESVLTKQVDSLVTQQNQIMQQLLNMSQMMMMQSMMFQQQAMLTRMNSLGSQNAYQYTNPQDRGVWMYSPTGQFPGQSNIFASSQGMYPDQAYSNWGLKPQMNFPQQTMAPMNGMFGYQSPLDGVMGFNLENSGQVQSVMPQQLPQPVIQTQPFIQNRAPALEQPIFRA